MLGQDIYRTAAGQARSRKIYSLVPMLQAYNAQFVALPSLLGLFSVTDFVPPIEPCQRQWPVRIHSIQYPMALLSSYCLSFNPPPKNPVGFTSFRRNLGPSYRRRYKQRSMSSSTFCFRCFSHVALRSAACFLRPPPSQRPLHLPPIIMRHLQPRPLKPTLDIKPLIRLTAVQYTLVTPHLLRHIIQRLNDPQS